MQKLGFGLMRLPKKGILTDISQVKEMVNQFMAAGGTYYDTAHVYPARSRLSARRWWSVTQEIRSPWRPSSTP